MPRRNNGHFGLSPHVSVDMHPQPRDGLVYGCILLLVSVVRGTKKTNKTPDDEVDNGTCLRETSDSNLLQSYDDLIAVL